MNARLARFRRMTPSQIYPLVKQMLEGLAAAHAAGIVHRDLKPANIFILREKAGFADYVKIIDFGISKFRDLAGDASQTRTGTIIGTPAYMSPEQARGLREADARSDIYSVGIIIYEAITGRVPFEGASTNDLLFNIFLNEVPPIPPDVDPAFGSIVMRALAKDPSDRFPTATEFATVLDTWAQTGKGVTPPEPGESPRTVVERGRHANLAPPVRPTQGAWADSRSGSGRAPAPGGSKMVVAAIAIALTALIGGAALFFALRPHPPMATAPASAPLASVPPPAAAPLPTAAPAAAPDVSPVVATIVDAGSGATPPQAPRAGQGDEAQRHKSHHPPPGPQPQQTAHSTANPLDQL